MKRTEKNKTVAQKVTSSNKAVSGKGSNIGKKPAPPKGVMKSPVKGGKATSGTGVAKTAKSAKVIVVPKSKPVSKPAKAKASASKPVKAKTSVSALTKSKPVAKPSKSGKVIKPAPKAKEVSKKNQTSTSVAKAKISPKKAKTVSKPVPKSKPVKKTTASKIVNKKSSPVKETKSKTIVSAGKSSSKKAKATPLKGSSIKKTAPVKLKSPAKPVPSKTVKVTKSNTSVSKGKNTQASTASNKQVSNKKVTKPVKVRPPVKSTTQVAGKSTKSSPVTHNTVEAKAKAKSPVVSKPKVGSEKPAVQVKPVKTEKKAVKTPASVKAKPIVEKSKGKKSEIQEKGGGLNPDLDVSSVGTVLEVEELETEDLTLLTKTQLKKRKLELEKKKRLEEKLANKLKSRQRRMERVFIKPEMDPEILTANNLHKEFLELKYSFDCEPRDLFLALTKWEFMRNWLAERVDLDDKTGIYTFHWRNYTESARIVEKVQDRYLKWQWIGIERPSNEYLIFSIDVIPGDAYVDLYILDICEPGERDIMTKGWDKLMDRLRVIVS